MTGAARGVAQLLSLFWWVCGFGLFVVWGYLNGAVGGEGTRENEMPTGFVTLLFNPFGRMSRHPPHQMLVVRSHMVKVWRNGSVWRADFHFVVSNCWRVCCWEGGILLPEMPSSIPAGGCFCR